MWIVALLAAASAIPNPYKVLKISPSATQTDIRKAFKAMTLKHHPDRNHDPKAKDRYEKVVNAYELLKDPQRKRVYDMTGQDQSQQGGGPGFGGFDFGGGSGRGQNGETVFTFNFGGGAGGRGMGLQDLINLGFQSMGGQSHGFGQRQPRGGRKTRGRGQGQQQFYSFTM